MQPGRNSNPIVYNRHRIIKADVYGDVITAASHGFVNGIINGLEDHLMKAINVMVESYCSLLPVLCHNTVVGVLRSVDLMHEIANVMGIQNDQSNERRE